MQSLSDTAVAFAAKYEMNVEDVAAVLGISYTAARNLLRGSPPTSADQIRRIEEGLDRNRAARSRDDIRLAEVR